MPILLGRGRFIFEEVGKPGKMEECFRNAVSDRITSEDALSSISQVLSLKGSGRLKLRLIQAIAAEYFEADTKAQRETDAPPPIKPED